MDEREYRRLKRQVLAFFVVVVLLGVSLGLWFSTLDPIGTCIPDAHPAICLSRCADVQPACR